MKPINFNPSSPSHTSLSLFVERLWLRLSVLGTGWFLSRNQHFKFDMSSKLVPVLCCGVLQVVGMTIVLGKHDLLILCGHAFILE